MKRSSLIKLVISLPIGLASRVAPILSLIAMCLIAAFLVLTIVSANRSFLVEANTKTLEITFGEGQNTWRLPDALICEPLRQPNLSSNDPCGIAFTSKGPAAELIVDWPKNTKVRVDNQAQTVQFTVLKSANNFFENKTRIVLSKHAWEKAGALTFRASVTLGQDLQSGSRSHLLNGNWEAREAGLVTSLFRNVTEVVKQGTLPSGSKATVLLSGKPAKVYGHFRASQDEAIYVNMVSQLGDTALSINSFGLQEPLIIEPDWVDSAISSPLLLALAALFSILASVSQVFSDTTSASPKKKRR